MIGLIGEVVDMGLFSAFLEDEFSPPKSRVFANRSESKAGE
jgi:hypothetical protein